MWKHSRVHIRMDQDRQHGEMHDYVSGDRRGIERERWGEREIDR